VDRVALLRLVPRELVFAATELVVPLRDAVRPRQQHLTPATRAHLVLVVAVEAGSAADGVAAQRAAELDDGRPLVAELELDLSTGRSR
jgi:hypothetical protein